jgi:hypothetical protein
MLPPEEIPYNKSAAKSRVSLDTELTPLARRLRTAAVVVIATPLLLLILLATHIVQISSLYWGPASDCNGCTSFEISFAGLVGVEFGGPHPGFYYPLSPWNPL